LNNAEGDSLITKRLFIEGLGEDVDQPTLKKYFQSFGNIKESVVVKTRDGMFYKN
jgi:RNA recognition motif-containing protein